MINASVVHRVRLWLRGCRANRQGKGMKLLHPSQWAIGTRSVVFGAHCLLLHWLFVARGWIHLNGWTADPRIWCAFVLHDIGYIGRQDMDGDDGETHVFGGAEILGYLFDYGEWNSSWFAETIGRVIGAAFGRRAPGGHGRGLTWYCFSFYHSRFMAKRYGCTPSPLCFADKLVPTFEPHWLYLPRVRASGELREYMDTGGTPRPSKGWDTKPYSDDPLRQIEWYRSMASYMYRWVQEHRDGREDTWTQPPAA